MRITATSTVSVVEAELDSTGLTRFDVSECTYRITSLKSLRQERTEIETEFCLLTLPRFDLFFFVPFRQMKERSNHPDPMTEDLSV